MNGQPAGVVLCGGRSSRFGSPKAAHPVDGVPMLRRVVDAVAVVCAPVIVVAAAGQWLPPLPNGVRVVTDREPDHGPLHGLAVGLSELPAETNTLFAASCDLPYLHPDFIRGLMAELGEFDAAVPEFAGRQHPLAAVYRRAAVANAWEQLRSGRRRMTDFLATLNVKYVPAQSLPEVRSLVNVNTPADLDSPCNPQV